MAIIKDAELKMAKLQIQEAIKSLEIIHLDTDKEVYTGGVIDHLNEALSHLIKGIMATTMETPHPTTKTTRVSRLEVIDALKTMFYGNNPESWTKNSNKQLVNWYKEYILQNMGAKIEMY